uniref:Protein kinase domain-containing protein n=1 Tax=Oryza brachyantha TaxID=4533 RepID=J3KVU8_ORYBR
MATPGSFCRSTALQAIYVLCLLVPDAGGRHHHRPTCPPFACGHLSDVSPPFRRRGDPPECGVASYELTCGDGKATIQIDSGTYLVKSINYTDQTFWVVDANMLDSHNTCPLPRWKRNLDYYESLEEDSSRSHKVELMPSYHWGTSAAVFVTCSREVTNSEMQYMPVACSSSSSFVYVLTGRYSQYMHSLEPSCGYLAMTPLALGKENASYADVIKLMTGGFAIRFPYTIHPFSSSSVKDCMAESFQYIREERSKPAWIVHTVMLDFGFWPCVFDPRSRSTKAARVFLELSTLAMWIWKWIAVFCRFILAPLVILTFLAHKYWKIKITTDAVEKFLRMQLMIGPTRYAYTDLVAITGHFGEKLGQGGYGSVYKGVLLPGNVHVAVKVLGNSNCNGEEFISEVSTIEEMRRSLVYEFMPRGSLDKYIFSSERSFSWDKLNEISLGIARGINYLHCGCDMQILHFDIKPHNILLDDNFVPKVADFGLAKLYPRDNSFVPLNALRGTIGYIAPEMISRSFGVISSKSDVYSFGMLLLEMAEGRRNSNMHAENSSQAYYPSWVYDQLFGQQMGVGETTFAIVSDMHEIERKLCIVGLHCIQMRSHDRPTMGMVIEMLEGDIVGLQMPPRPFFCDDELIPPVGDSYHFSSELIEISEEDE